MSAHAAGRRDPPRSTLALAVLLAACRPDHPADPDQRADGQPAARDAETERGCVRADRLPGRRVTPRAARRRRRTPTHGAYRGNLKRIVAKDASTVVVRAVRAGRRVPDEDRLARVRHQRRGLAAIAHRPDGDVATQAIVGQVNGTGPYRLESGIAARRSASRATTRYWGNAGPERAADRALGRGPDGSASPSSRTGPWTASTASTRPAWPPSPATSRLQAQPRAGRDVVYLGFATADPPFGNEKVRQAIAARPRPQPRSSRTTSRRAPRWRPTTRRARSRTAAPAGTGPTYDPTPGARDAGRGRPAQRLHDDDLLQRDADARRCRTPAGSRPRSRPSCLTNLGIQAKLGADAGRAFTASVDDGTLDGLHLLDRAGRIRTPSAYLDPRFGAGAVDPSSGTPFADIDKALAAGRASPTAAKRETAYAKANDLIRQHVPMIPIGRATPRRPPTGPTSTARTCVTGRPRAFRGHDPRRSTPARLADDRPSRPACTAPTRRTRSPGSSARR